MNQDDPPPNTPANLPVAPESGSVDDGTHHLFTNTRAIAHRTARGASIYASRALAVQLFQVASSLILARYIFPSEFGAFALAVTIIGFARYVGDLGISQSFIPMKRVSEQELQTGALISLTTSLVSAFALIGVVIGLGAALALPAETRLMVVILSSTLIIDALRFGAYVGLNRRLAFERIGLISLIETLALYLTQVGGLLLGFGLEALVAAQLVRSMVATGLYVGLGGGVVVPRLRAGVRRLLARGISYQAPAIVAAVSGLLFPIAVAAQLGASGLGFWAWSTVLAAPVLGLLGIVHTVCLPSFARLKELDPSREAEAIGLVARISAILAGGAGGLLVGAAPLIVPLIFDERWIPAVGAVQVSVIGLIPSGFGFLLAAVLESRQRATVRFAAAGFAGAVGFALIFPFTGIWGITGAAVASAIVAPTLDALLLSAAARAALGRACLNAGIMFAVSYATTQTAGKSVSSVVGVLLLLVGSGLVVAFAGWLTDRGALRSLGRFALQRG